MASPEQLKYNALVKTLPLSVPLSSPTFYQGLTFVLDWAIIIFQLWFFDQVFVTWGTSLWVMLICNLMMQAAVIMREELYFSIFGNAIAAAKRAYYLDGMDKYYLLQTWVVGTLGQWLAFNSGKTYWKPIGFDWYTFTHVFCVAYALDILKDVFSLLPLHALMHEPQWYWLHKEHHRLQRNTQAIMAYHIDIVDFVVENMAGMFVYLFFVNRWGYLIGIPPGIHTGARILNVQMDVLIHSINPFTQVMFNPIMDLVFRCNVAHQLHHALQTKNFLFVPWHHIIPGTREKEVKEYNKIMKTQFEFAL